MATKDFDAVFNILKDCYPNAKPMLEFNGTFELLVAVILSAQCTDKRVNIVSKTLFQKYNTPETFAMLSVEELEPLIRTCGLSKSKAKHIIDASKKICENFNGQVPDTREELMSLDGVGRKTANVVLSVGFGKNAIAVDTHVFRVANRIGVANAKDVKKTELDLMKNIKEEKWGQAHHLLIYHGRAICKAQKPLCEQCKINGYCKYYKKVNK